MSSAEPNGHRLLVVDDEVPILFAMRQYFTLLGYTVVCAREREEAEALLANDEFSLVIADLRLTGLNSAEGLDLVHLVKGDHPQTRIIVLTAYGSPEIELETRRLGVDALLHKPQPLAAVAQLVARLLAEAR